MTMRISGMASGMDIDTIVSNLMKAERMPLDKIKQKKTLLEFQMDAYRDMNTKLISLRDKINSLKYASSFNSSSAKSSNEAVVTATAGSNASPGTHTILVEALASTATRSSGAPVSTTAVLQGSAIDPTDNSFDTSNSQFTVTLNGVTRSITIDAKTYSSSELQSQLQDKINAAFGANKIQVSMNSDQLSFKPLGTAGNEPLLSIKEGNGALAKLGFSSERFSKLSASMTVAQAGSVVGGLNVQADDATDYSFTVNGVSIQYKRTDTLQSIMNKVNSSNAGVTMTYDSVTSKFTVTSKATGASQATAMSDTTGNLIDRLNLTDATASISEGKDAKVTVDNVISYRDSNNFTIDGMTYELKQTSTTAVTVNSGRDTESIVNKIKDFVKQYNETLAALNGAIAEKKVYGYDPLTEDQRKELSETDAANWDKQVKKGLLRNDTILSSVSSNLRSLLTAEVPGVQSEYNSFYKIGLNTAKYTKGAYNASISGMIELDETKLTEAVNADPDAVLKMFTQFVISSTDPQEKAKNGIMHQMVDKLSTAISDIVGKAGRAGGAYIDSSTTLGFAESKLNTSISLWEDKLISKEDTYYKRFSAMEQALAKSNSQMNWLSSQLG